MACPNCGKSVFDKARDIISGTLNVINKDPEIEKIAIPRLEICSECIRAKVLLRVRGRAVLQCKECKCLCELKVRVEDEKCPLNKW